MGGAVTAIEHGFQRACIEAAAYDVARGIDSGERVVVGVNRFTDGPAESYQPLRVDPVLEAEQVERVRAVRSSRDASAASATLDDVRAAAAGERNVLPPIKSALAAHATVGEICAALREVWGSYEPAD